MTRPLRLALVVAFRFGLHHRVALPLALFVATAAPAPVLAVPGPSALVPTHLVTELRTQPLGIDAAPPRLGWILEGATAGTEVPRGLGQTAYQILAASNTSILARDEGDLWSSGRVASNQNIHVPYRGKGLHAGTRVHWKVRIWDSSGAPSAYSLPSWFEMGLLRPQDWEAVWLEDKAATPPTEEQLYEASPAPLFRREFTIDKEIVRARVYVSGLGYYELFLNGQRVGDHVLDPGWTTTSRRVLYSTYDVTAQLRQGTNAIGAILGNGWYNPLPLKMFGTFNFRDTLPIGPPRVILHLRIDCADGSSKVIVTDPSWRVGRSGLLRNNIYLGELFDARKNPVGWTLPGFDDSRWEGARIADGPIGPLRAQDAPPIKITRNLRPVKLTEPRPGLYVFDMGQNFAGWVTVRARGPSGTRLALRYAEVLYPDGTPNGTTTFAGHIKTWRDEDREAARPEDGGPPKTAWQQDVFILRGQGVEAFSPRFSFHGFRYVALEGFPGRPTLDAIEGHRLGAAVETVGEFSSSNPLFGRIQDLVLSTQLSNMFSVQSDNPHRGRLAFGADVVATGEMAMLNFDMSRFYAKTVRDFDDAALPSGGLPETAPFVGIEEGGFGGGVGPIGWGIVHPFLVRALYEYYGDRALLEEQYGTLQRWTEFLRSKAHDHIIDRDVSDHESLGEKAPALTGTALYGYSVRLAAEIADILRKTADVRKYRALEQQIRAAFNRRFLNPRTGTYGAGDQTCQAFPLGLGLVPASSRAAALQALVDDIEKRQGRHLSTGIFGTKFMLNALSEGGRPDVAGEVVGQTTFPGWGYMLENGATTLWETWRKDERVASQNQPMLGSVGEWFYKTVAGIAPDRDAIGFDKIVFRPAMLPGLTWARGVHQSVRGRVESDWKLQGETFTWNLLVPPQATAIVHVPARAAAQVREGDGLAVRARGVTFLRAEDGTAVFKVVSGRYQFTSQPPPPRPAGGSRP